MRPPGPATAGFLWQFPMVKNKRGPDGLTDFERNICNALDGGMTYREAYRAVRPDSKASDKTAESYA